MRKSTKRSEAKLATRERLLDIAEATFVNTDFKASTFAIARKAGIAHGTIFFHFKNRDELVLAVVKRLVKRMTDALYEAYKNANNLEAFLSVHVEAVRTNWALFKALFSGFSKFNDRTKQEVLSLLSVINYYLVEAFNKWTDNGLVRTILWQGALIYLSFFGDYMFDKKKISEKFIQRLLSFSSTSRPKEERHEEGLLEEKKLCQSCGMIFHSAEDFPMGDMSKIYCKYCAREDGTIRPFNEVLNTMITFFEKTQVLNRKAAQQTARAVLAKNPAWKDYIKKTRRNRMGGEIA
ncbi:MAG: TetR family transcriptional regulator [candidate division WOR-3 bacterium]|nr:MAG: TetR family transcriptional regulator [candidate division WOR-3 bacterium]